MDYLALSTNIITKLAPGPVLALFFLQFSPRRNGLNSTLEKRYIFVTYGLRKKGESQFIIILRLLVAFKKLARELEQRTATVEQLFWSQFVETYVYSTNPSYIPK
jgi:hypothetical protein